MSFVTAGGLSFVLGVWLGVAFWSSAGTWQSFTLTTFLCWLGFAARRRESGDLKFFFLGILLLLALGGMRGAWGSTLASHHVAHLTGQQIELQGDIVPDSVRLAENTASLRLKIRGTAQNGEMNPACGEIYLFVTHVKKPLYFPRYGTLAIKGKLDEIRGFANPGSFDMVEAARIRDIGGRMVVRASAVNCLGGEKPLSAYLAELNEKLKEKIRHFMSPSDSAILSGMTFGGYDGIDEDKVQDFSTTGMVHILSVSGSHVALLVGFVLLLGRVFRLGRKVGTFLAALLITIYGVVCGFSPPVLRSVLMGFALLLGLNIERAADRGAVLFFSAVVMLIYKPLWILDIGFRLSFISTAGLIYLLPLLQPHLHKYLPRFVSDAVAVCLAAQLAVLPFLVYYFHYISLCSLLANFVALPMIETALLLTLGGVAFSFVFQPLGALLLIGASLLLGPAVRTLAFLSTLPWGTVTIGATPVFMAGIYYLLLWLAGGFFPFADMGFGKRKTGIAICICALLLQQAYSFLAPKPFRVYFLDVGQGDAALVVTPERRTILIDTGGLGGSLDTGRRIVVPALRYFGFSHLDVLLLSHGHHDHAGGAAGLASIIPIDTVLLPREEPEGDVLALLRELQNKKTQVRYIKTGDQFFLKKCIIDIISAQKEMITGSGNETSALVRVGYDGSTVLFTGDITAEGELDALPRLGHCDVLKVSHHGSASSSAEEFLRKISPESAVISVGAGNRFGHPRTEVLQRLRRMEAKIYRTDEMGAIQITFQHGRQYVYGFRTNPHSF